MAVRAPAGGVAGRRRARFGSEAWVMDSGVIDKVLGQLRVAGALLDGGDVEGALGVIRTVNAGLDGVKVAGGGAECRLCGAAVARRGWLCRECRLVCRECGGAKDHKGRDRICLGCRAVKARAQYVSRGVGRSADCKRCGGSRDPRLRERLCRACAREVWRNGKRVVRDWDVGNGRLRDSDAGRSRELDRRGREDAALEAELWAMGWRLGADGWSRNGTAVGVG